MNPSMNINFFILNQLCIYAQYGQMQDLESIGIPSEKVQMLTSMSTSELEVLSRTLGPEFIEINGTKLIMQLENVEISPFLADLLIHGASNKIMAELVNVSKNTCTSWRRFVNTDPNFKQRSVPSRRYQDLWRDIEVLPNPQEPLAEELLMLAKAHKVGIGAIWAEIKKGNMNEK